MKYTFEGGFQSLIPEGNVVHLQAVEETVGVI